MSADGSEPPNQNGTGLHPAAFNHFAKRSLIARLLIVPITSKLETLVGVYLLTIQPFYSVLC